MHRAGKAGQEGSGGPSASPPTHFEERPMVRKKALAQETPT